MIEVRNDDHGCLDELVGQGCAIHLERMDTGLWCLIVTKGEHRVQVNLWTRRNGLIGTTVDDMRDPTHAE